MSKSITLMLAVSVLTSSACGSSSSGSAATDYVYVVNQSGSVTAYAIGKGGALFYITGVLATSSFPAGSNPWDIAISPSGECLYALNDQASGVIAPFSVGSGGVLSPITTGSLTAGTYPGGIVITSNGKYLYVANQGTNSDISAYAIGSDCTLSPIVTSAPCNEPLGMSISPNGKFLYVTNQVSAGAAGLSSFAIGTDGTLSPLTAGSFATGEGPEHIAITPSGAYLYVVNGNIFGGTTDQISAFSIGPDGALTPLTPSSFRTPNLAAFGIAISPNGKYAYVTSVTNTNSGALSAFFIGSDGLLTSIDAAYTTGLGPRELAISSDGSYLYLVNWGDNDLSVFAVGSDGRLSPITAGVFSSGGTGPNGIGITQSGRSATPVGRRQT